MEKDIFVKFEVYMEPENLTLQSIKENKTLKIKSKYMFSTINKVPFHECEIKKYDDILIGKIKRIFDLGESLDLQEKLKE